MLGHLHLLTLERQKVSENRLRSRVLLVELREGCDTGEELEGEDAERPPIHNAIVAARQIASGAMYTGVPHNAPVFPKMNLAKPMSQSCT